MSKTTTSIKPRVSPVAAAVPAVIVAGPTKPGPSKTHRLSSKDCATALVNIAKERERPMAFSSADAIKKGKDNDAKPGFRYNMIAAVQAAKFIGDVLGSSVDNPKAGKLQKISKTDIGFCLTNHFVELA